MASSWHMLAHSRCSWKVFKGGAAPAEMAWGRGSADPLDMRSRPCHHVFPVAVGNPQEEGVFLCLGAQPGQPRPAWLSDSRASCLTLCKPLGSRLPAGRPEGGAARQAS